MVSRPFPQALPLLQTQSLEGRHVSKDAEGREVMTTANQHDSSPSKCMFSKEYRGSLGVPTLSLRRLGNRAEANDPQGV